MPTAAGLRAEVCIHSSLESHSCSGQCTSLTSSVLTLIAKNPRYVAVVTEESRVSLGLTLSLENYCGFKFQKRGSRVETNHGRRTTQDVSDEEHYGVDGLGNKSS